jgi:thiol peroxidase
MVNFCIEENIKNIDARGRCTMERKDIVTFLGNPVTLVGTELKVGDKAPEFTVIGSDLKEKMLKDFDRKVKIISVTPSLDTPVCDLQARRFNMEIDTLPADVAVINMSVDLPFAIKRFCTTAGIDRVQALSDHRETSFGIAYGILMKESRLLARAVFIVDKDNTIQYIEIVPEVTSHPDYDRALDMVKKFMAVKA